MQQVIDNAGAMNFGPLTDEEVGQVQRIVAESEAKPST
jgi:hypothetical protein